MIVSIHQPMFLPWLGYFEKVLKADVFVILDDVQFEKNGWQNRNRIKTPQGAQWLTVPIHHRFPQTINDVELPPDTNWTVKHLRTLAQHYQHAPYWEMYRDSLTALYARPYHNLLDINMAFFDFIFSALQAHTRIVYASQLDIPSMPESCSWERKQWRLVAICRHLGATEYYSGRGGNYISEEAFAEAMIGVTWQEFGGAHPIYPQQHISQGFIPCLSVIDVLLNCGPDMTRQLLLAHQRENIAA